MDRKNIRISSAAGFADGDMKQSQFELQMEDVLQQEVLSAAGGGAAETNGGAGLFGIGDNYNGEVLVGDLGFQFRNEDRSRGLPSCGELSESPLWSPTITQIQPCMSATIDSQSSVCAGSPTSKLTPNGTNNQARAARCGSFEEQSDEDDDAEIEAGPCEQSTEAVDNKRIKRKASNRESARRSRKRRQAHLADLEQQVDLLSGKNNNLYKQLTVAHQQLRDATTNHRVLKSDVEALRAKVKLAEEMVTHGSLSCNLNHLLQSHNTTPPQLLNSQTLFRMANMSQASAINQNHNPLFAMAFDPDNSSINNSIVDALNGNPTSSLGSDDLSCVTELCAWETQIPTMSN